MKRVSPDERYDTPARTLVRSPEDLGAILRMRRKELRIRQEDLAYTCGISRRLLSEIEHGKPGVAFSRVLFVANEIGIDLTLAVRGK